MIYNITLKHHGEEVDYATLSVGETLNNYIKNHGALFYGKTGLKHFSLTEESLVTFADKFFQATDEDLLTEFSSDDMASAEVLFLPVDTLGKRAVKIC